MVILGLILVLHVVHRPLVGVVSTNGGEGLAVTNAPGLLGLLRLCLGRVW
ncbi:hypothetical protein [Vulcanisaeta moutnovskia]|nr:hypothetical protein [Vulcanisaeta moutnovskia]